MNPWVAGLFASVVLFQLVAVPALILKKNDLADVLWGPAFPFAAAFAARGDLSAGLGPRQSIVLGLISIWGLRLFLHVGRRNLSHLDQEDARYANWRKQWGNTWLWRSWLQVFVLQPLILYIFLLPVLHTLSSKVDSIGLIGAVGTAIWIIGFACETLADEQLRRFKHAASNRGKLITSGLWGWSRHPNYFGEIFLWWGIWIISMEDQGAWWTVVAPIGVTYLILKVSGVSMLEDLMKSRPGYEDYVKNVPRLIPLPQSLHRFLYRKRYAQNAKGGNFAP